MKRNLHLIRGSAWNAVFLILVSIGIIAFLWTSSVNADTARVGRDYLLPEQAKGGFIDLPSSLESDRSTAKISSTTSYRAFDGSTHQLLENRGRYVNVLIPLSYDSGLFLPPTISRKWWTVWICSMCSIAS